MAKTIFDKIWDAHIVETNAAGTDVLYIDRHFIHEVTSPQAFDTIRDRNLKIWDTQKTTATADHNVPTVNQHLPIAEPLSRHQVETLKQNCAEFGIEYMGLGHAGQGIVHVIGPEQGLTKPGMTIVCGDSHTSTHGAFGTVAFGIGTSQVGHVFASQCIMQTRPKTMNIRVNGLLQQGVVAKDLILYLIQQMGTGGATGYFIEYSGSAIESLSMEGRMTVCNMSIEMGARGGLIAPDDITFNYLKGRTHVPTDDEWETALTFWKSLRSEDDARYDVTYEFNAGDIEPMITYGTNPGMSVSVSDSIPNGKHYAEDKNLQKALNYMDLKPGTAIKGQKIDYVFIGSCTNGRIEDLRLVANFVKNKTVAPHVKAWVIPGSKAVESQAKEEGLVNILELAGMEFRQPGCSACLGMNEDKIPSAAYCLSTSNRNFEGRQGPGSRTFLASPLTAAAAAVMGVISDCRETSV
jgi:3-isopropylmalate/(R)-2-methylmalate dehydratase large subunit